MKKATEHLWWEYMAEECARIETEEEKKAMKELTRVGEELRKPLTEEQNTLLDKFAESLGSLQSCFMEKAFVKGIRFATSFLWDALKEE